MLPIVQYDSYLEPYENDIILRKNRYQEKRRELFGAAKKIAPLVNGYSYYGLHFLSSREAVFREWAPGAEQVYLFGDFNDWNRTSLPLTRKENGDWEIRLSGPTLPKEGQHYKLIVSKGAEEAERIPAYAMYVVQDPSTYSWSAVVFHSAYTFRYPVMNTDIPPVIYECHIGMATEEEKVGTYEEFRLQVLPYIEQCGYNTIQIMAVQEHPYYASFGYQVSSFFAPSSRYGTPDDLKRLIDDAHRRNIRVLLDLVHAHSTIDECQGLNRFDLTDDQYFHPGERGLHPSWGTKLFQYNRNEVLHFLLSNVKFWMEEYRFDGFRFDGVTSMLYRDHAEGYAFTNYAQYFSPNTDLDATTYLSLANELIHEIHPQAITIAEDMSGMPGLCLPLPDGGIGFDYRLQMGAPDLFIRLIKEVRDEDWSVGKLYYELTGHRPQEKVIGYAESHDQALVGDQTILFRLCDSRMYTHMRKADTDLTIDRGMALHKLIRLLTFSLAPNGYLNFMGNEFGHPEWIDFPRAGNGWSYAYCRRQWSLRQNPDLKYEQLGLFDERMQAENRKNDFFREEVSLRALQENDQVLLLERAGRIIALNFHPQQSFTDYFVPVREEGTYEVSFTTDDPSFGGFNRIDPSVLYHTKKTEDGRTGFFIYLPARTGIVYKKREKKKRLFRLFS